MPGEGARAALRLGRALADDLERWLNGDTITARPVSPVVKGWKWARRNRVVASLLGLVGLLFFAGIAGLIVSNAMLARMNAEIQRERDRADRAVDDMYTQVAERLLPFMPGMEETRREFLDKVVRHYEEQAALGNGSSAAARQKRANAYTRVGKIQSLLGQPKLAEPALQKAVIEFERLQADFPRDRAYRVEGVDPLIELAKVLGSYQDKTHRVRSQKAATERTAPR